MATDNASNMGTAFAGPNWKHIHCVAHTLNLYVDEGLQKHEVQRVLARSRSVVLFFHCSPLATVQLKKKQEELQLPLKQSVATRSNSAVEMLKRGSCCHFSIGSEREIFNPQQQNRKL